MGVFNNKHLPQVNQSGLVTEPNLSQSNGGSVYPLTVWQSLGANVYFEPKRALKTAFNSPPGKRTSRLTRAKRSDRAIVVKVLTVLDGEKFVRLPELPKGSIHRTPRPLGSLNHPTAFARLNHTFLCRSEQRYANTGHIQGTRMKFGSHLPSPFGPTVCIKRLTEPTKRIRLSVNAERRSCNSFTQRHYGTNSNGIVMGSDTTQ